ncbi:MAG: hypothetical protein JW751_28430 [Polyangiaceae bacterium]|nr:hypothetical protein [Polyangiaceae bacterium]
MHDPHARFSTIQEAAQALRASAAEMATEALPFGTAPPQGVQPGAWQRTSEPPSGGAVAQPPSDGTARKPPSDGSLVAIVSGPAAFVAIPLAAFELSSPAPMEKSAMTPAATVLAIPAPLLAVRQ